jgi:hypothetical protein
LEILRRVKKFLLRNAGSRALPRCCGADARTSAPPARCSGGQSIADNIGNKRRPRVQRRTLLFTVGSAIVDASDARLCAFVGKHGLYYMRLGEPRSCAIVENVRRSRVVSRRAKGLQGSQ